MRILIHGINFHPEPIGTGKYTGEMANWLSDRGHEVKVVTAPPFNPQWRVASEYTAWKYRRESCPLNDGPFDRKYRVLRCPIWVPQNPTGIRRLIHLVSFALSSCPVMLWQTTWKPDLVFVVEPTLFCGFNALLVARCIGAKAWLHVQDFEIDAAFQLGDFSYSWMRKIALIVERGLLSAFDNVSTISERMIWRLVQKGVDRTNCVFFPNWVDTSRIYPILNSAMRRTLGIAEQAIVLLYSGSMGRKQGLDILVDAARHLSDREDVRFVFCGEGPHRETLVKNSNDLPNVLFLPCQPLEQLNELLNLADIHVLPQLGSAADLVMPSKLTGIFASGRPVIATADPGTQLATLVQNRGIVTSPGNLGEFLNAVLRLASDSALRARLGREARSFAVTFLDRNQVLSQFEEAITASVGEHYNVFGGRRTPNARASTHVAE